MSNPKGNFVGEWFGYRVFPFVHSTPDTLRQQGAELCPFLSEAKGVESLCIKTLKSRGVCTVTTSTLTQQQDWLVCPYRALDPGLLNVTVRRLFGVEAAQQLSITPAIRLGTEIATRLEVADKLTSGERVFLYFDEKLGGELSIPGTERSPEFSFDVTIIEIELKDGRPHVGRFGVIEIQTMDFHGSYGEAVRNLKDTLRMFPQAFGATIEANKRLLGERVEGPNIANVFKRTFYQMMFKFQLGHSDRCAGCVLAIPQSVWDSWRAHLGQPVLTPEGDGTTNLFRPGMARPSHVPAWIYVFELEAKAATAPSAIEVKSIIATDAPSFSYYALEVAPEAALANISSERGMISLLARRLWKLWPDLAETIVYDGMKPKRRRIPKAPPTS